MLPAKASVRQCPYCGDVKTWLDSGLRLKDGSKVFKDEDGARWAGRRCPQCEKNRVTSALRCGKPQKQLIAKELKRQGASENQTRKETLAIRRAWLEDGAVVLDEPLGDQDHFELVALIFESVRILTKDQYLRMKSKVRN